MLFAKGGGDTVSMKLSLVILKDYFYKIMQTYISQ